MADGGALICVPGSPEKSPSRGPQQIRPCAARKPRHPSSGRILRHPPLKRPVPFSPLHDLPKWQPHNGMSSWVVKFRRQKRAHEAAAPAQFTSLRDLSDALPGGPLEFPRPCG